jgi:hypothetical protein
MVVAMEYALPCSVKPHLGHLRQTLPSSTRRRLDTLLQAGLEQLMLDCWGLLRWGPGFSWSCHVCSHHQLCPMTVFVAMAQLCNMLLLHVLLLLLLLLQ